MGDDNDKAAIEIDLRSEELRSLKMEKVAEFEMEEKIMRETEGAVSAPMMDAHREALEEMDNVLLSEQQRHEKQRQRDEDAKRAAFNAKEAVQEQAIIDRRNMVTERILAIKKETVGKTKAAETAWQSRAAAWLGTAKRKVDLKTQEDKEAKEAQKKR